MSEIYGVLTVGAGTQVRRASRAGDQFGKAEISVVKGDGTDTTYRLVAFPDGVMLFKINKRYNAALATPEDEWDLLFEDMTEEDDD